MSEQQHGQPSLRAEVEQYQKAVIYVRRWFSVYELFRDKEKLAIVLALAQERVAELSRRAEAAEQDEIAWRGGP